MQKSHKKVRVADFCRENMLDYYEMVEALKQEKFEVESYEEQVQCGDIVMQTDTQENKIQERDDRILGLLDQIANNMVRKEDEITVDCYPEGCDENSKKYGKRTNVIWELSLPKLKKMLVNLYRCKVNGKKVWAKMPNRDMYQDLLYYANTATAKCGELLMKAINYAKAEWKGLIKYTEDGRYRADNNAAESIMRDLACGRKNFLFCGSDNAAKNLAFAYSLTESCKLNNINPYDYWSDLIDFIGCEGIDLNSFVHSQWHKHTKAA